MYFHIITTTTCNSECRYCYKKSCEDFSSPINNKWQFDFSMPEKIEYSIDDLKAFFERSKNRHTLTFYGGEPFLEIGKIKEIIDKIDARYMAQTNGKLLDKIESRYLNKFDLLLISIDGNKQLTDFNRGKGTYDKIMSNVELIRKNGFNKEIVARMVVDEYSSLVNSVRHLFKVGFDSVHWQLDAAFYSNDLAKRNFEAFIKKYNLEIVELLDFWVSEIKKGKVLKIYPFLGVFESIYYGIKERLRCGSGYANYTIATNGKISVCPIMHDIKNFQVGDIWNSSPDNLPEMHISGKCSKCEYLDLCGGRCLYANQAELWGEQGQELICSSVKNLIDEMRKRVPLIKDMISKGIVNESQFYYERYSGPEIIP